MLSRAEIIRENFLPRQAGNTDFEVEYSMGMINPEKKF